MSESDGRRLADTTVGVFLASAGTEAIEFTEPKAAVAEAGATVDVLGSETGEARTVNDDLEESAAYEVEKRFDEVSADDYDALIVPGEPRARTRSGRTRTAWNCCANTSRTGTRRA